MILFPSFKGRGSSGEISQLCTPIIMHSFVKPPEKILHLGQTDTEEDLILIDLI